MGKIILVCGGNKRAVENYTPRSLVCPEPASATPFWLDLLSPSERVLHRISVPFKFDPRALKACLSYHHAPSCEDFGDYVFITAFILEPSKKKLFFQRDMKIFLSSDYLITIHKSPTPLHRLVPGVARSRFTHPIGLLLRLFDESIFALIRSFPSQKNGKHILANTDGEPTRNPLWWRLRNFRTALLGYVHLLDELAYVGVRFFEPEDMSRIGSITLKICLLLDMISGSLDRTDLPGQIVSNAEKGKSP